MSDLFPDISYYIATNEKKARYNINMKIYLHNAKRHVIKNIRLNSLIVLDINGAWKMKQILIYLHHR